MLAFCDGWTLLDIAASCTKLLLTVCVFPQEKPVRRSRPREVTYSQQKWSSLNGIMLKKTLLSFLTISMFVLSPSEIRKRRKSEKTAGLHSCRLTDSSYSKPSDDFPLQPGILDFVLNKLPSQSELCEWLCKDVNAETQKWVFSKQEGLLFAPYYF